MTTLPPIVNVSSYRFAHLQDLKPLRSEIRELCISLKLKGTILLSAEGINLFVAGLESNVHQLMERLRKIPGLESLTPKISRSDHQPFRRMLVKIKKEIISFGVEGIDPVHKPSPKLSARELKKWLDEKKPITLLDTRNDYEVKLGTFKNAINPNIHNFRQFPKFAETLGSLKEKPVVMFCTGGIRCEKAGPLMEKLGFKNIFQLDGGILKYFEEVGSDHYDGDCFVFDGRVGVDPALAETPHKMCFACLSPLTLDDQKSPKYILGKSCPHCFKNPEEHMSEVLALRHEGLRHVIKNLGKTPYKRRRPIRVPQSFDGKTLLECVSSILKHMDQNYWKQEMDQGLFETEEGQKVGPGHVIKSGERYFHKLPAVSEPPINGDIKIRYEDEALIVVEKPAPLPVVPSGRFDRHTLQSILSDVYQPKHLRPVHRLDSNTTGLLLLAKTRAFAAFLHRQFADKSVEKSYLVKVVGHPQEDAFTCDLPISDQPGDVGSRTIDEENGLDATTHFKVLERLNDGTSLLEARPITGRTNQIRVHLWSLGYPICGDQLYLAHQQLGDTQTTSPEDSPLCLHASRLAFIHPITHQRFEIESPKTWA